MALQGSFPPVSALGPRQLTIPSASQAETTIGPDTLTLVFASAQVQILAYNSAKSAPTLNASNSMPIPASTLVTLALPHCFDSWAVLNTSGASATVTFYPLSGA